MDTDKIQAYRDEQQRQSEREQELAEVSGVGNKLNKALNFQTNKLIANAKTRTNKVQSVDPIASPKDIQAVVDGLNSLGDKLAPKELKPVVDALGSVVDELSKLPKKYPDFPAFPKFPDFPKSTKVDNLNEIKPWLEAVVTAVGKLKLAPKIEVKAGDVNIPETKIDLSPITQGLIDVKKALDKIKLPETDFSKLEKAVATTTKAINSLSFPVPNYVIPFKDINGRGVQVQLDASGNIPTSAAAGGGLTNTELRATPVPVSNSSTFGTVGTSPNAINVGQRTVSTTAVQISASATVPTNGILVQALAGNGAAVYVGGSGVTTSTGWELSPGQAIAFTCTLNTIYIISVASTTDKICYQVV